MSATPAFNLKLCHMPYDSMKAHSRVEGRSGTLCTLSVRLHQKEASCGHLPSLWRECSLSLLASAAPGNIPGPHRNLQNRSVRPRSKLHSSPASIVQHLFIHPPPKGFKRCTIVSNVTLVCLTRLIRCFPKTLRSVLANQPTVLSVGVRRALLSAHIERFIGLQYAKSSLNQPPSRFSLEVAISVCYLSVCLFLPFWKP